MTVRKVVLKADVREGERDDLTFWPGYQVDAGQVVGVGLREVRGCNSSGGVCKVSTAL